MATPDTLSGIRAVLAGFKPAGDDGVPDHRKAAVAAVLRSAPAGVELLFIHRANQPHDPWSGHMAFPGGRVDPDDPGPLEAAIREAREELSLDLESAAELLGRLSEVTTHLPMGSAPRTVVPFVFALRTEPALTPNAEVQAALWVPLSFLAEKSNRKSMTWTRGGVPLPMPCYHWEGRVIWGLTLRIVDELLSISDT